MSRNHRPQELKTVTTTKSDFLRFNGAVEHSSAIDAWMKAHAGELGAIAHEWFEVMRKCGDEVRELLHDGCPVACLGDAPFGYVNVFTSHVNLGFFHGASLPDPAHLLEGNGKFMRHVKLRPGRSTNAAALNRLIENAYAHIKARVEHLAQRKALGDQSGSFSPDATDLLVRYSILNTLIGSSREARHAGTR